MIYIVHPLTKSFHSQPFTFTEMFVTEDCSISGKFYSIFIFFYIYIFKELKHKTNSFSRFGRNCAIWISPKLLQIIVTTQIHTV